MRIGERTRIISNAKISADATIDADPLIGEFAKVRDAAEIGNDARIVHRTKVGSRAKIEESSKIAEFAGAADRATIGQAVRLEEALYVDADDGPCLTRGFGQEATVRVWEVQGLGGYRRSALHG